MVKQQHKVVGDVNAVYQDGIVYKLENVVLPMQNTLLVSILLHRDLLRSHLQAVHRRSCTTSAITILIWQSVLSLVTWIAETVATARLLDYPNGTYAYFITEDDNGNPAYPYILGNEFYSDPVFPGSTSAPGRPYVYDIGGIEFNIMENYWHTITDVDPGNNRIEIGFNVAQFTAAYSEQGGNLLKIANLKAQSSVVMASNVGWI